MSLDNHRSYSVWHDSQEQWDPDAIDKPALRCLTGSHVMAAQRLADAGDDSYGDFIVRDDAAGTYRLIKLVRGWAVKSDAPTTLEELCAP